MQLFNNLQDRVIQDKIITLLEQSTTNVKIAVTWFTNLELFDILLKKLEIPGYKVDLIVLNDRINNKREGADFQRLIDLKGNFYYSDTDKMVHHKFCIIDDKILITGSYNWTYYAEQRNWENILVSEDSEAVNAYIQEFNKVIQHHEKVENIASKRKLDLGMNSNDYLEIDYTIQAEREVKKGNDVAVAKIYTEILKLNNKQEEIKKARTEIVSKINNQRFQFCPFEIGILYKNGYATAIPAFSKLPITVIKGGSTTSDTATSLQITIQKYDYTHTTLLTFSFDNLKACPTGTEKIEHTLTVDQNGILTIVCRELNGFNRIKPAQRVDLKTWI